VQSLKYNKFHGWAVLVVFQYVLNDLRNPHVAKEKKSPKVIKVNFLYENYKHKCEEVDL